MRKYLFLLCLALAAGSSPALGQASTGAATGQSAPSKAYFLLANDLAKLLQRATALPSAQAAALLRQEAPALQLRAKHVKPTYQKWLKSLPAGELAAENKRIAASAWGRYFSQLETNFGTNPKFQKLLQPGSPSGQLILDLMGIFEGV